MSDEPQDPGWWQATDGKPHATDQGSATPSSGASATSDSDVAIALKPWWKQTKFIIPIALFAIFVAIWIAGPPEDDEPEAAAVVTVEPVDVSTPEPIAEVAVEADPTGAPELQLEPTAVPEPTATFEPEVSVIVTGRHTVGVDIEPGMYRVHGYWARLDANLDIIDDDRVDGNGFGLVTVWPTDTFLEVDGVAVRIENFRRLSVLADGYTEGTYIVGVDIEPGRYVVSDDSYAYGARLDSTGRILASEGKPGSINIVIAPSDRAFRFSGELRPGWEVTAETQEEGNSPIDGEIGESYELSDGQILTVTSIELHPDATNDAPFDRTHVVNVRVENPTDEDLFPALGLIRCEASFNDGSWFADSTYGRFGFLPVGASIEGELILGIRADEPDCVNPVVRFWADYFGPFVVQDRTIVSYPIEVP